MFSFSSYFAFNIWLELPISAVNFGVFRVKIGESTHTYIRTYIHRHTTTDLIVCAMLWYSKRTDNNNNNNNNNNTTIYNAP